MAANQEKKTRGVAFFAQTYDGDVIPKKTKWIFSIAAAFRDGSYQLVSSFLLTFMMYAGVLGTGGADYNQQIVAINIIFVACLIWDGLNDPIMGVIIERFRFKSGKYKPWILIGGIGNSIVMLCLFLCKPTGWAYVATFAVFYFLWDFVFTMNDCAYWAMVPSMTSEEKERNNITFLVSLFISIGTFAMYGVCSIIPNAANSYYVYGVIAIVSSVLFLLSQLAIFFFCKEKRLDPNQEAISDKTTIADMFRMVGKNRQLLVVVISIFLYYAAASLVVAFGSNYFYLCFGYGGDSGGAIMLVFTVMYAIGTIISQVLFKPLVARFKRSTLLTWCFFVALIAYLVLFLVGFPLFGDTPLAYNDAAPSGLLWAFGGTLSLLYIPPIFFFAAQGVFYMVLLVDLQNCIEYNEWKFGERKEAVASSWRPFTAKLSSALQKGLILLSFLTAGIYDVTQQISGVQNDLASQVASDPDNEALYQEQATAQVDAIVAGVDATPKVVMGVWMVGSALAFLLASYLLMRFLFKIDEDAYRKIESELKERKSAADQSETA